MQYADEESNRSTHACLEGCLHHHPSPRHTVGFTGTPFIDNYPTFAYIRSQRQDKIPDLIDRSFYVYTSEALPTSSFEERFARFQGTNSNVLVEYVPSDFIQAAKDELAILSDLFTGATRTRSTSPDYVGPFASGLQQASETLNQTCVSRRCLPTSLIGPSNDSVLSDAA